MSINKLELFEHVRSLWPQQINLGGMIVNNKHITGLQILNELYYEIEASFDINDHWHQLAIWAFHQALWVYSEGRLNTGESTVHTADITFEIFDQKMRENLEDESWAKERAEYLEISSGSAA
jgi:hypothetical protein